MPRLCRVVWSVAKDTNSIYCECIHVLLQLIFPFGFSRFFFIEYFCYFIFIQLSWFSICSLLASTLGPADDFRSFPSSRERVRGQGGGARKLRLIFVSVLVKHNKRRLCFVTLAQVPMLRDTSGDTVFFFLLPVGRFISYEWNDLLLLFFLHLSFTWSFPLLEEQLFHLSVTPSSSVPPPPPITPLPNLHQSLSLTPQTKFNFHLSYYYFLYCFFFAFVFNIFFNNVTGDKRWTVCFFFSYTNRNLYTPTHASVAVERGVILLCMCIVAWLNIL